MASIFLALSELQSFLHSVDTFYAAPMPVNENNSSNAEIITQVEIFDELVKKLLYYVIHHCRIASLMNHSSHQSVCSSKLIASNKFPIYPS